MQPAKKCHHLSKGGWGGSGGLSTLGGFQGRLLIVAVCQEMSKMNEEEALLGAGLWNHQTTRTFQVRAGMLTWLDF